MTGDANDGWARAVRSRLGLGRLLPLGGAADGSWIAEKAAAAVLMRAAENVPGLVLHQVRLAPADPEFHAEPLVPSPPGALPPGPLRIEAEAAGLAGADSIPAAAERLRGVLVPFCADRIGLLVTGMDVRVTGLLEAVPYRPRPVAPDRGTTAVRGPAAEAAAAVPGVASLTGVLGAPVHTAAGHVRVEIAVAAGHRALSVALAVRAAVAGAAQGESSVGVLVTTVELP
ncbi:hypothetical protein [Streptomyces sp. NBC_00344]|uniref:hypothetical protein n=1 Tax=Streptomyces sp. NBC_00344 TaxID=2975720 RepID=UPI002E1DDB1F